MDIANKPAYYLSFSFMPVLFFLAYSLSHCSGLIPREVLSTNLVLGLVSTLMLGINRYQEFVSKSGLFDRETIHKYERFLLDAEDARRLFVAAGIRDLANQFSQSDADVDPEDRPQIVVCYPEAHARRIANYLVDRSPMDKAFRIAKQIIYKTNFWLDTYTRIYEPLPNGIELPHNSYPEGWRLASTRGISPFH